MSGSALTRRGFLAGAASLGAARALADDGPPRHRPGAGTSAPSAAEGLDAIFARSRLGEATGFLLVDLDSGAVVEGQGADVARPPASVQKMVTALWARETLGPDYRFATRLLAGGPVVDGRLRGDLALAGDGDPTLDTDRLGALAAGLGVGGVRAVEGRFLVAEGALPGVGEIDDTQPADAAYNPGVGGLNLNFNRVFAGWKAGGAGLAFRAPGEAFQTEVDGVQGAVGPGLHPERRLEAGAEVWSMPAGGMRRAGSLWLPVARPGRYAGEVFRRLAGQRGLVLPQAEAVPAATGAVVGVTLSADLDTVLRDMLRFSTNLTAEVVGLRASQARGLAPANFAASAAAMAEWAAARYELAPVRLVNHSGLSGAARVTPAALVRLLRGAEGDGLPALLPPRPILDAHGQAAGIEGVTVRSKTGTMDFVSGLAGYMIGKRRLAFAILVSDVERRATITPEQRAAPPGAEVWLDRARGQEQALLRRWATLHAGAA